MTMGYVASTPPVFDTKGKCKVYVVGPPTIKERIASFNRVHDPMDSITGKVMSSLFNDSVSPVDNGTDFGGGDFGGGGAGGEF